MLMAASGSSVPDESSEPVADVSASSEVLVDVFSGMGSDVLWVSVVSVSVADVSSIIPVAANASQSAETEHHE